MFCNRIPLVNQERLLEQCVKIRNSALFGSPGLTNRQIADEALLLYYELLMDRMEDELEMKTFKENLIREHQEDIK